MNDSDAFFASPVNRLYRGLVLSSMSHIGRSVGKGELPLGLRLVEAQEELEGRSQALRMVSDTDGLV